MNENSEVKAFHPAEAGWYVLLWADKKKHSAVYMQPILGWATVEMTITTKTFEQESWLEYLPLLDQGGDGSANIFYDRNEIWAFVAPGESAYEIGQTCKVKILYPSGEPLQPPCGDVLDLRARGYTESEKIAVSLLDVAKAIRDATYRLGTAGASSPMGALEFVGASIEKCSDAIDRVVDAIGEKG